MGAGEAYLGVVMFWLFGPTTFALRMGLMPLYALFLACMYWITSILYTKQLALVVLLLLSVGSGDMLVKQLMANGGLAELLFLGALFFLLSMWLVHSSTSEASLSRLVGYAAWGLIAGLGLWSDFLFLPFAIVYGVFLLIFYRRGTCADLS